MKILLIPLLLLLSQFAIAAESAAPDFTLKSTSGENLRLSEQRGQVGLINFWASWCGPCRQEMPLLDEMQKKYAKLGFTVFGVNVDQDQSKADKILKNIPVSFPVLYDTGGKVSRLFDVSAMPTTVIVDRDGNMRYLHKGFKPGYEETYAENVKALIRE